MTKKLTLTCILTAVILGACSNDDDNENDQNNGGGEPCETTGLRYSDDIQPIIQANCALSGCHTSGSRNMTSYEAVRDYALDGSLEERITLPSSNPLSMPPNGSLDDCTIDKIISWVNDGAPE